MGLLFFCQPGRGNGNQRQRRFTADAANGPAQGDGGLVLRSETTGHDAQVDITITVRGAARVGSKEPNVLNWVDSIKRLQTFTENRSLRSQCRREIIFQNLHLILVEGNNILFDIASQLPILHGLRQNRFHSLWEEGTGVQVGETN